MQGSGSFILIYVGLCGLLWILIDYEWIWINELIFPIWENAEMYTLGVYFWISDPGISWASFRTLV